MATVHIYAEHRGVLDSLISSAKVASQLGAAATGPFKDQRDAYVFASSIGLALGRPIEPADMPRSKTDTIQIRDSVFLGADGARELSITAVLLQELGERDDTEAGLRKQLEEVADGDLAVRFSILDRYAYSGFAWLASHQKDVGTTRELVMEAIDKVIGADLDPEEFLVGDDPLGGFLI